MNECMRREKKRNESKKAGDKKRKFKCVVKVHERIVNRLNTVCCDARLDVDGAMQEVKR
jgi:hypothetical protein